MAELRTKNTKRNIFFSYLYMGANILFQFVSRTIIVNVLGDQYLGLSSLFSSVLTVLNMAELGFSSAILYNMYKPIAEGNIEKVNSLLSYYRKIYRTIGFVVGVIGIAVLPFVPYLIKGSAPEGTNIYLLYLLYLANTCVSYFLFAYKTSLLEGLQRLDLVKVMYTFVLFIQYALQIVSLVCFKNYYLFVISIIVGSILRNVCSAYVSKKRFPQYVCQGIIEPEVKKDIISRVKGLLVCNISSVTYTTFDSIIISICIGLSSVAIYNNYITVFNGVMAVVTLIRGAMQASVGNSVAVESREKNYNDLILWQFLFSVIATICATCLLCLFQPFMELWMGSNRLLPFVDIVIITMWFFVSVIQHPYCLYLSANGMWWELRWPYITSAISNIILNIILGKLFGITGIVFATLFSTLIFGIIWQCKIIFKKYFNMSFREYFKKQFLYFIVMIISCTVSYFICINISTNSIPTLIIKAIICVVVSIAIMFISYFKTDIFKRTVNFVKAVLRV